LSNPPGVYVNSTLIRSVAGDSHQVPWSERIVMNSPSVIVIVFLAGLGAGWFGNIWVESNQLGFGANTNSASNGTGGNQGTAASSDATSTDSSLITQSELAQSSDANTVIPSTLGNDPQLDGQRIAEDVTGISTPDSFNKLLNDRRYFDAMTLFQEQKQQSDQKAAQLRISLINELEFLTKAGNNSDFSELVENYLSVYYDDIDVLLLLAENNQVNSSYLEVVNVYLLAKTYAYSNADQEKVARHLNNFVMEIDRSYTEQKDWFSLIGLYSHIYDSGLMTTTFQYRQALAHLRSGDEAFAIEEFNQLLNDSLVGELAAKALSSLTSEAEPTIIVETSPWEGADSIALQKFGNQYAVNLDNDRQGSVQLLIDTGASMTAVSRETFNTLNASGDAVQQDSRVFRTANGVVQAPVFSVPELNLGPHRLENTQIAVIDFNSDRGVGGLLGMNILGQFRFQIDQDSSHLLLNKK